MNEFLIGIVVGIIIFQIYQEIEHYLLIRKLRKAYTKQANDIKELLKDKLN